MTGRMSKGIAILLFAAMAAGAQEASSTSSSSPGMLGLGGRATWSQQPFGDARSWIDAQAVLRPLPRLFFAGTWGRTERDLRGDGPDTTVSELRWDLTVGMVLLQGAATGYVPLVWSHRSERHSWWGDARWTEIGTGAGVLWPVLEWLQLRGEIDYMHPTEAHDEPSLGPGRQIDGGRLELSLGFLAFVR
jgi:hypothetical protein